VAGGVARFSERPPLESLRRHSKGEDQADSLFSSVDDSSAGSADVAAAAPALFASFAARFADRPEGAEGAAAVMTFISAARAMNVPTSSAKA
jgi:hypothetical protein